MSTGRDDGLLRGALLSAGSRNGLLAIGAVVLAIFAGGFVLGRTLQPAPSKAVSHPRLITFGPAGEQVPAALGAAPPIVRAVTVRPRQQRNAGRAGREGTAASGAKRGAGEGPSEGEGAGQGGGKPSTGSAPSSKPQARSAPRSSPPSSGKGEAPNSFDTSG